MEHKLKMFVYENCFPEFQDNPGLRNRVRDSELIKYAFHRLRYNGFLNACSRCGGTGSYSFNQMDGTRCFKCGGNKFEFPRLSKKFQQQIQSFDWSEYSKKKV